MKFLSLSLGLFLFLNVFVYVQNSESRSSQEVAVQEIEKFISFDMGNDEVIDLYTHSFIVNPSFPTIVALNGLTYSTKDWEELKDEIIKIGLCNVVLYDFEGMGMSPTKTLAKNLSEHIGIGRHSYQLVTLLGKLQGAPWNLSPKFYLMGLSFGGAIGIDVHLKYPNLFPNLIKGSIAINPYSEPLQNQDNQINTQMTIFGGILPVFQLSSMATQAWVENARNWLELNSVYFSEAMRTVLEFSIDKVEESEEWVFTSDEEFYNYFLRIEVFTKYVFFERSLLRGNPSPEVLFKRLDDVYKNVVGIRHLYLPSEIQNLQGDVPIHLVISVLDEYIHYNPVLGWTNFWTPAFMSSVPFYNGSFLEMSVKWWSEFFNSYMNSVQPILEKFWDHIPEKNKGNHMLISAPHKAPEHYPKYFAEYFTLLTHNVIPVKANLLAIPQSFVGSYLEINYEIKDMKSMIRDLKEEVRNSQ